MAAAWIFADKIFIDGQQLKCSLTDDHKYSVVKAYNASMHFSDEEKRDLLNKCFENDDTDAGKTVQKICDYNKPDEKLKQ